MSRKPYQSAISERQRADIQDVARIAAVAVTGPTALAVTWSDGTTSTVDLAGWIARGSQRIAPLRDPAVFARAVFGLYGGNVTWDGDEGDLAIDAEHPRMIAGYQAPFAAAEVAAWQAGLGCRTLRRRTSSASCRLRGPPTRRAPT